MFKTSSNVEYFYLSDATVDMDLAKKHLEILKENTVNLDGKKLTTLTYKQVLQSFGDRNWNGRTYDQASTLRSIDNNPLIQHDIANKSWGAEYGHPIIEKGMNELQRQMTILPTNLCNTINKYWLEGNLLMGECTTVYGQWGEVLMGRILTGFPAMASSRGVGGVDSRGHVLPGQTVVTFDTVVRPSHKQAYQVKNSEVINDFVLPTGNTMNESATLLTIDKNEAFKSFILSESIGNEKIEMVLDTMGLDYGSMEIQGNNIVIKRINENSVDRVFIPLKKVIATEYHNLF